MFEGDTSDEEPPPAKKPRRRIRRISERNRRTITAKLPPCHGPDCSQEVENHSQILNNGITSSISSKITLLLVVKKRNMAQ